MNFKKIIIYGWKSTFHTHAYIHESFHKGFQYLGYDSIWVDEKDDLSNINFDDCLFLTEGQQLKNIPLNKNSKYILHNCDGKIFSEIPPENKLNLQFYHNDVLRYGPLEKINLYTYVGSDIIYLPWGTNKLPNEIDENSAHNELNNRECIWVGSYDRGDHSAFQNNTELDPFFDECRKNNIKVTTVNPWIKPVSNEENEKLVRNSFLAPAINGVHQKNTHYAPCRIFKNISYSHIGITNNSFVNDIFDGKLVYSSDPVELFHKSLEKKNDPNVIKDIKDLMINVKNNHTYINRINAILNIFKQR